MENNLPSDYHERVYAGWTGKCIGVRFGAPLENWTNKEIKDHFGTVTDYFPLPAGKLFKPDDDTAFPMILVQAILDHGPDIRIENIADTILNYLADQKGTLWWGGYGISTEHTAYMNLAKGISPLLSGSMLFNGKVLAEQIGGQIFSDLWGMIIPCNGSLAADISEIAARITHDGEGLNGARFIAALASEAFSSNNPQHLIGEARKTIPDDSEYAKVVDAIVHFYTNNPDSWREAYNFLFDQFGYDRYPGLVPIIPNAGVIVLSLLYGKGNFSKTIQIGNMCGWDTDCNVGNLGAIMGILAGINAIDLKWIKPMQDQLILASIIGENNYTSISECALKIARCGELIVGQNPKTNNGHHFDFTFSTQGFTIGADHTKILSLYTSQDSPGLHVSIKKLGKKNQASFFTKTSCSIEELSSNYYGASFSPKLYPGQRITAHIWTSKESSENLLASLYVKDKNTGNTIVQKGKELILESTTILEFAIPPMKNAHLLETGVIIRHIGDQTASAHLVLRSFAWEGEPEWSNDFSLEHEEAGGISQWTIHRGYWRLEDHAYIGSGLEQSETYTGSRMWKNYRITSRLTPLFGTMHGILARVQGARRSYGLYLVENGVIALFKKHSGTMEKIASSNFDWKHDHCYTLALEVNGKSLRAFAEGALLFEIEDTFMPLEYGLVGLSHGPCSSTRYEYIETKKIT